MLVCFLPLFFPKRDRWTNHFGKCQHQSNIVPCNELELQQFYNYIWKKSIHIKYSVFSLKNMCQGFKKNLSNKIFFSFDWNLIFPSSKLVMSGALGSFYVLHTINFLLNSVVLIAFSQTHIFVR